MSLKPAVLPVMPVHHQRQVQHLPLVMVRWSHTDLAGIQVGDITPGILQLMLSLVMSLWTSPLELSLLCSLILWSLVMSLVKGLSQVSGSWMDYQCLQTNLDIWEMRHFLRWLAHRRLGFSRFPLFPDMPMPPTHPLCVLVAYLNILLRPEGEEVV